MATKGKDRSDQSIRYNALSAASFNTISPGINTATTTLQGALSFPYAIKVYAVTISYLAAVANSSYNIVLGTAAEGALIVTDSTSDGGTGYTTNSVSGTKMFADIVIPASATAAQKTSFPVQDAIIAANTVLSLRVVNDGTGTLTTATVTLHYVPFDVNVSKPTTAAFTASTDL